MEVSALNDQESVLSLENIYPFSSTYYLRIDDERIACIRIVEMRCTSNQFEINT